MLTQDGFLLCFSLEPIFQQKVWEKQKLSVMLQLLETKPESPKSFQHLPGGFLECCESSRTSFLCWYNFVNIFIHFLDTIYFFWVTGSTEPALATVGWRWGTPWTVRQLVMNGATITHSSTNAACFWAVGGSFFGLLSMFVVLGLTCCLHVFNEPFTL